MSISKRRSQYVIRFISDGKWGILNKGNGWFIAIRKTRKQAELYAKLIENK